MNIFRLPTCPHCNTVYRYGDVKKLTLKKKCECYNCRKSFEISRAGIVILFLIVFMLAFLIDIFELVLMSSVGLVGIFVTNVIAVLAGIMLIPYFIGFKKAKDKK